MRLDLRGRLLLPLTLLFELEWEVLPTLPALELEATGGSTGFDLFGLFSEAGEDFDESPLAGRLDEVTKDMSGTLRTQRAKVTRLTPTQDGRCSRAHLLKPLPKPSFKDNQGAHHSVTSAFKLHARADFQLTKHQTG